MGKTKSFNACTNYALDHKGKKNLEIENFYISVVLLDSSQNETEWRTNCLLLLRFFY